MTAGTAGMAADSTTPPRTSVRTVILGVDRSARIVQYDRNAPNILARSPETLLGTSLSDLNHLVSGPNGAAGDSGRHGDPANPSGPARPDDSAGPGSQDTAAALIEAVRSDREGAGMLAVSLAGGRKADAVVTVHPMRAAGTNLAALALLRIPVPAAERFVDPAVLRHSLMDGTFTRIGSTLDTDQMARELVDILVPHFCNAAGLVMLDSLVGDELPAEDADRPQLMRRLAVAYDDDPSWEAAFPPGELLSYPPGSPYHRCMIRGEPILEAISKEDAAQLARSWQRPPVVQLHADASMLVLPLIARGVTLGFLVCTRANGYRRFDAYDLQIGMEFAARAAIFIDHARRYNREHATALALQRSMLPTGLSAPSSVEVRHRYLPGSKLIEVGGDWYESITLPGARVALVVGDVAGHGVRAAVTMGRLRTAIQTLAMLELPPAESLQQLNELMHSLGVREPHFATCAYAVFDAVSGTCEVAVAGHLPPLLVRPDGSNEFLGVTPAPPLGIGDGPIESREFTVEDGSLFVLYTDGLVENRTRDIDDGLLRLRRIFGPGSPSRPLEDLCTATLDGVYGDFQRDDIAVLIARLRRIPQDRHVTWTLGRSLTSVRHARSLIREPMQRWGLSDLLPVTELLVSELVTNALRYSPGEITLRMVLEGGLVCEVRDNSAALPRLRQAGAGDENGRGLQVVSQLTHRWGTRRTRSGKVVWCEQTLPGSLCPSRLCLSRAR